MELGGLGRGALGLLGKGRLNVRKLAADFSDMAGELVNAGLERLLEEIRVGELLERSRKLTDEAIHPSARFLEPVLTGHKLGVLLSKLVARRFDGRCERVEASSQVVDLAARFLETVLTGPKLGVVLSKMVARRLDGGF